MRIKVHDGTPETRPSLCQSCRHSRVTRGHKLDEEIIICNASHLSATRVAFQVTSCSHYADQKAPTYFELIEQAWILQPGSRRRPAGFVRASDLRDEEFEMYRAALNKGRV
jgi:hypothetical protein